MREKGNNGCNPMKDVYNNNQYSVRRTAGGQDGRKENNL